MLRPLTRYLSIALALSIAMLIALQVYLLDFRRCQQAYFKRDTAHTLDYCARPRALNSLIAHHRALAHEYLGAAYTDSGQYKKAIAEETATIAIDPRPLAYSLRGFAYYEDHQYDAAIADLKTAIAMRPADSSNYHNLALALRKQGKLAEAVEVISSAISLHLENANEYVLRAMIHGEQGRIALAIKDARQALRLGLAADDFWSRSALCRYLDIVKATGDATGDCAMLTRKDYPRLPRQEPDRAFAEADGEAERGHFDARNRIVLSLANSGNALAQREVGDRYRYGWGGTQKNDSEAMAWYLKAAATGDPDSEVWLGAIYAEGKITPQNYLEAMRLYRLAAAQGDDVALLRLSEMYFNGTGVARDPTEAMKFLRMAAGTGYGRNSYILGSRYETGDGTVQNKVLAYMWYDLEARAYEFTYKPARAAMDRLSKQMPEADMEHAEHLAAKCLNSDYNDCDDAADGS